MIYGHLFDRVPEPATVRAGLIGARQFGTPIVSQAPAFSLSPGAPVSFFVLKGRRLTTCVPQGKTIALEMIEPPADSALWSLHRQQDAQFLGGQNTSGGE